jgi:hypothetical protein
VGAQGEVEFRTDEWTLEPLPALRIKGIPLLYDIAILQFPEERVERIPNTGGLPVHVIIVPLVDQLAELFQCLALADSDVVALPQFLETPLVETRSLSFPAVSHENEERKH